MKIVIIEILPFTRCYNKFIYMLCLVPQVYLTLYGPMDCGPPGFSVHGYSPGMNIGEWVAMPYSRVFSQPRDQTQVSLIAG